MSEEKENTLEQGGNGLKNDKPAETNEDAVIEEVGQATDEADVEEEEVDTEEEQAGEPEEEEEELEEAEVASGDAQAVKDQLLRTLAEFENFKKRSQREIGAIIDNANERLISDLLPFVDDFERALKAAEDLKPKDKHVKEFLNGLSKLYNKLMKPLNDVGLKAFDSIGEELDVDKHDALMQVEMEGKEPNIVVEEHEKGYYLNDKVIRHAKVIVTK